MATHTLPVALSIGVLLIRITAYRVCIFVSNALRDLQRCTTAAKAARTLLITTVPAARRHARHVLQGVYNPTPDARAANASLDTTAAMVGRLAPCVPQDQRLQQ
jgi:hypothetical protein